jgi:hypothetical protein
MSTQDQPPRDTGMGTSPGAAPGATARPGETARAGETATPGATARPGETARPYVPRPSPGYDDTAYVEPGPKGLAKGFTLFAAIMLMLSGIWNIFEGVAGIIGGSYFIVLPTYAFSLSTTGFGLWHLVLGAAVLAAGAYLLMDVLWARVVGVVLAGISAISNFLYIPYYPVWSIVVIAIDVFVIWALLAPRRRVRPT